MADQNGEGILRVSTKAEREAAPECKELLSKSTSI